MAWSVFVSYLAALAMAQASGTVSGTGQEQDGPPPSEVTTGHVPQSLPFALNLDPRPPRSLQELVDRLYRAIPGDRLDMFAAYYGGPDFERIRARYDSTVSFFYDLYTSEILTEAARVWGFSETHFPLARARRCAGEDFVKQVSIQIGIRRLFERGTGGEPPPLRDMVGAYGMAARISRQLFAICDGRRPPPRATAR